MAFRTETPDTEDYRFIRNFFESIGVVRRAIDLVKRGTSITLWVSDLMTIYYLNNCLSAYRLGKKVVRGIPPPRYRLAPDQVVGFELPRKGKLKRCYKIDKRVGTGWLDENPLGKYSCELSNTINIIAIRLPPTRE